jgi:hypothetical protein
MDSREVKAGRPTTRREFLAESAAAGFLVLAPARAASPRGGDGASSFADRLKEFFLNPPQTSKPMTRWWWFGGAVTPEEITRELTMMRDAGLRGIELQPLYPVAVDDPARGIRHIRYFSPEWFDLLRHTVRETRRLGLQFDFTLGSGWPYGGPFIPDPLAARKVEVLVHDAEGPGDFSWQLTRLLSGPWSVAGGAIVAAVATPVADSGQLDVSRSVVISDRLKGEFQVAGEGQRLEWKAPPGRWKIMLFAEGPTGEQVSVPSLGMEGFVIDHFSRPALDLFLRAAGDRTLEELRPLASPPFHSVFCDSFEVWGADWTPRFMEEFSRRRGYDLAPYLPALYQEGGELTPHVRYDYHLTLSDLMLENFFAPFGEWAHRHGMTARLQAHGSMADTMHGYGLADIPEAEDGYFFAEEGWTDRYSVNTAHRRLASSAGHLYGKPIISAESYTWLRMPLHTVTLEMMKGATDSSFLDGINQIVNQGYSYSPPQAGEPGWVFYAETNVNHTNIWWRHYKCLAGYIQRAAALLLQGVSINPIAVYAPLADVYSDCELGALLIDGEIEARLGKSIPGQTTLLLELRRAGYDFDLINDDALQRLAHVEAGKLRAGTGVYSVVIVPSVTFMPPESVARLAEFAAQGGCLIFLGRLPDVAPGLKDRELRTRRLREQMESIWGAAPPGADAVRTVGKGQVIRASDRAAMRRRLGAVLAPDFEILAGPGSDSQAAREQAHEDVGFTHRQAGDADFYFLSNIAPRRHSFRARFAVAHKAPQCWWPETGATDEWLVFEHVELAQGRFTEVEISLEPFESCFIVFGSEREPILTQSNFPAPLRLEKTGGKVHLQGVTAQAGEYAVTAYGGRKHRFAVRDVPGPLTLDGPWRLRLGDRPAAPLDRLQSWTDLAEGKDYSGWGTYETDFEVPDLASGVEWVLDLGEVHETAEARLNGKPLGAAWKGSRKLNCSAALQKGSNHLVVEIGNLWIQHVHAQPKPDLRALEETFGVRWPHYGEIEPKQIPPSGLLGPVRLVGLKRVSVVL